MGIGRKILSSLLSLSIIITPVLGLNLNVSADEINAVNETVTISEFPELLNAGSTSNEEAYWRKFSSNYYYNQMSANEKTLYDRIDENCMNILLSNENVSDNFYIDCYDLEIDKKIVTNIQFLFKLSNPQYFFVTSLFAYSSYEDDPYVVAVSMYLYSDFKSGSSRVQARENLRSVFNNYLDEADDYYYPEQKEITVFELMCENITYYSGVDYDQSVYSAATGATVCTGYALLLSAIMNACGIECATVASADHAWNIIKIHGYWYYVDVTWADQDSGDWIYYKYYNWNKPSDNTLDFIEYYMPDTDYDMLSSDYYYSNRYYTDGSVVYCLISDTGSTGLKVVPVSGSTTAKTIEIDGYTYTIIAVAGSGWRQEGSVWCYYDASGYKVKGWAEIEGDWYYFNSTGEMQKKWVSVNGTWYYLGGNGIMRTGWQAVDGTWYYFSQSGAMSTGWQSIGGSWYFFGGNGAMRTYWQNIDGSWYYFGNNGVMRTNWQQISNKWYYFGGNGVMRTGWQAVNGKWYYLDSSGYMRTGWTEVDGAWYYLDSEGAMKTGWYLSGSSWYYLDTNGKMVTGKKTINGKEYSFNSDGVCQNP